MVVKRKMAEQLAEHSTRFTTDYCQKNIARRQLDGQHLLFGVCLQTRTAIYLLNMHYRGELNIDEGKNVLTCFKLGIICWELF